MKYFLINFFKQKMLHYKKSFKKKKKKLAPDIGPHKRKKMAPLIQKVLNLFFWTLEPEFVLMDGLVTFLL